MNPSKLPPRSSGFTVIELLVSITVLAVLVSLLLPATQQAREEARLNCCEMNLRQLAIGLHNYHETNSCYPAVAIYWNQKVSRTDPFADRQQWSWTTAILPHLGQSVLFDQIDFSQDLRTPANRKILRQRVSSFYCPTMDMLGYSNFTDQISGDTDAALIDYAAVSSHLPTVLGPTFFRRDNSGSGVLAFNDWSTAKDVTDGLGQTLLLTETRFDQFHAALGGLGACLVSQDCSFGMTWGQSAAVTTGDGINQQEFQASGTPSWRYQVLSPHTSGAQFAFADGHISFINDQIEPAILSALSTRAGQEIIEEF